MVINNIIQPGIAVACGDTKSLSVSLNLVQYTRVQMKIKLTNILTFSNNLASMAAVS